MAFKLKNFFAHSSHDNSNHTNNAEQHLLPVKVYVKVFFILLAMIFANIGISKLPIPNEVATGLLLFVAFIQAVLVCVYFMELIHEDKFYSFAWIGAILFMILFFVVTLLELNGRAAFDKIEGIKYMRQIDLNNNFAPAGPEMKQSQQEKKE